MALSLLVTWYCIFQIKKSNNDRFFLRAIGNLSSYQTIKTGQDENPDNAHFTLLLARVKTKTPYLLYILLDTTLHQTNGTKHHL